jgi:hypothetical protein
MDEHGPAGGKPTEFWLMSIRDIVEKALVNHEKFMCNTIGKCTPELEELAKQQHSEIIARVDTLIRALYIASGIITALVVLMAGTILFALSIVASR